MFQTLQLPRPAGVVLTAVRRGSPAEAAGLRQGDVITAVNGHEVDDPEALRFRIATLTVGTAAQLTVWRNGREEPITAQLSAPPDTPARDTTELKGRNPFTGAVVANMNPALAEEMGLENDISGVTVLRILRGSIANRLQFQPGDVILKVNGRAVPMVADLRAALAAGAEGWTIVIRRNGETLSMSIGG
jgi:serine protease Do